MSNNNSFTAGKIFPELIKFTLPILFALCLQAMYGAVDLMVVGHFGSTFDVSAVATGSQIMQTITTTITGLAMGTTVLLGRKIGEGREKEAGSVIGCGICMFAVLAICVTAIMMFAAGPFSKVMQAPEEAFSRTVSYVKICSSGSVFIIGYNVLGSIFRGLGDSKTPLFTVLIACIVNIIGDLILVGPLQMGSAGAALATVLAQGVSVAVCLYVISKRELPFPFKLSHIRFNKEILKDTIKIGLPISLQDTLVSISFLAIMAIVNSLGVIPSAGVGVAEKVCAFIMLMPSAFMQALSAFVAQNMGAGKLKRAKQAMAYGMAASLTLGIVMAYISFFHGQLLAGIFSKDAAVIAAGADYLKAYAIDTMLVSFLFCFAGYFSGCGKTTFVMVQGIVGAFLVRIPVSYIMSHIEPVSLFHIGLATPASTVVQITLCGIYFVLLSKRQKKASMANEAVL